MRETQRNEKLDYFKGIQPHTNLKSKRKEESFIIKEERDGEGLILNREDKRHHTEAK